MHDVKIVLYLGLRYVSPVETTPGSVMPATPESIASVVVTAIPKASSFPMGVKRELLPDAQPPVAKPRPSPKPAAAPVIPSAGLGPAPVNTLPPVMTSPPPKVLAYSNEALVTPPKACKTPALFTPTPPKHTGGGAETRHAKMEKPPVPSKAKILPRPSTSIKGEMLATRVVPTQVPLPTPKAGSPYLAGTGNDGLPSIPVVPAVPKSSPSVLGSTLPSSPLLGDDGVPLSDTLHHAMVNYLEGEHGDPTGEAQKAIEDACENSDAVLDAIKNNARFPKYAQQQATLSELEVDEWEFGEEDFGLEVARFAVWVRREEAHQENTNQPAKTSSPPQPSQLSPSERTREYLRSAKAPQRSAPQNVPDTKLPENTVDLSNGPGALATPPPEASAKSAPPEAPAKSAPPEAPANPEALAKSAPPEAPAKAAPPQPPATAVPVEPPTKPAETTIGDVHIPSPKLPPSAPPQVSAPAPPAKASPPSAPPVLKTQVFSDPAGGQDRHINSEVMNLKVAPGVDGLHLYLMLAVYTHICVTIIFDLLKYTLAKYF